MSVITGLLSFCTLAVRIGGRVALAREQRRTMTAVATALAAEARSARAWHRTRGGDQWSLTVGASDRGEETADRQGLAAPRDGG
ncbi:hypothetical protein [Streptomyces sp. NPDC001450]